MVTDLAPSARLWTEREAAERLAVSPGTLRQWRYLKTGPPFCKIGRSVRYKESDLQAWIKRNRVTPA